MRAAPPASHRPLQRGRKVQSTTGRAWRGAECSRQRSRDSGSTIFRGTWCSEDAQLQIQPWALPSPPCRSPLCKPSVIFALGGCKDAGGGCKGCCVGFCSPPPPLICPSKPNHPACWKPRSPASLPDKLGTGYREGTGPGESGLLSHQKHVNC